MSTAAIGMPRTLSRWVTGAVVGAAIGVLYTLSPMTVLSAVPLIFLVKWTSAGLTGRERRWFFAMLAVAVVMRLAAIGGLFVTVDDARPWATLFGDEQFFKNRSLWMRNLGMGVPVSPADLIYAVDEVGETSYLYLLAFVQALVGEAPYGIHVMNATLYLAGVLLIYRVVRPAYGPIPSLAGLGLLLFVPSLAVWSISALKEPAYTLTGAVELVCALYLVRASRWRHRIAAALGIVVGAVILESLRRGGSAAAALGVAGGLALGVSLTRPRLFAALAVTASVALVAAGATPAIRSGMLSVAQQSAAYHAGHVQSSGYSYKIIDARYYRNRLLIPEMTPREAAVYVARSVSSYVTEPVPWRSESFAMRAYWPEQVLWYLVLALVPVGLAAGVRRDPLLTCLIGTHALSLAMMVALTSGNIGTLIRHRGLVLPYLAWLAGLGAYDLLCRATAPRRATPGEAHGIA